MSSALVGNEKVARRRFLKTCGEIMETVLRELYVVQRDENRHGLRSGPTTSLLVQLQQYS
ncbi:hypothetical protein C2857_005638 [Epichloe festucae Fl1]|uniref:Uncharacterized protein n=1 Tax=Epichloe festucae (strain Fl1) TaxID=877507 RepID=A0A7S9KL74_EPIFF|nr:hypothetical protein C2857_005638 [Epichloe festucae Fl1]